MKKTAAKKTPAKKTAAKKASARKPAAKKTAAKKTPAKKPAKKASAKKPAAKKTAAQKTPAKKPAKKASAKKPAAKTTAAKKTAAKKTLAKKAAQTSAGRPRKRQGEEMTDTTDGPYSIRFHCYAVTGDFRDFAGFVLGLLPALDLPSMTEWSDYRERHKGNGKDIARAVALQPSRPQDTGKDPVLIGFDCEGPLLGTLSFEPVWGEASLATLQLQWVVPDAKPGADALRFQQRCADLCARIMERFRVHAAHLHPEGGGALCFPEVPLVTSNSHIVVTNAHEVEDFYDDAKAFWDAGWHRAAEHDGQILLTRALDRAAGPAYLEQIIDYQWAMARAAKPGEATYGAPVHSEDERLLFGAGSPRLQFVGHDADERLAEYSCVLDEGEHIRGWEIYALRDIVENQALPDGHPVDTVRVVFMDEWAARAEKRPLLDIGCRVFHCDADGKLRELVD